MAESHLARLGRGPRPAGGTAAAAAQGYCGERLSDHDFVITKQQFEFSKFPGSWATPAAGIFVPACTTVLVAVRDRGPGAVIATAVVLLVGVMALGVIGSRGVLGFPFMRARGTNLEAIRGTPRIWLVAHIDSKWQPVAMSARVVGVVGSIISVLAVSVCVIGGASTSVTVAWLVLLWLFSIPLMLSVVGARNAGTLDNASGVATVLEAIEQIPRDLPIGVLITDAEELALAGAAAWASTRAPGIAINVDSVDDDGPLVVMHSGSSPRELVSRIHSAASSEGETVRILRLIPGVLTDHVALAARGWTTLTLSRGTVRTLQRIHTSRDTLHHMDGRGISGAAKVLARTILELT